MTTTPPGNSRANVHTAWAQCRAAVYASPVFDGLLRIVKDQFRVSTALLFSSHDGAKAINMRAGLDPKSFDCAQALALCHDQADQADQVFAIEEVAGVANSGTEFEPVQFYAGAPLVTRPGGPTSGMLCLIHTRPRDFSSADRVLLASLANAFSALMQMPHNPAAAQAIAMSSDNCMLLLDKAHMVAAVNPRFTEVTGFGVPDLLELGIDDLLHLYRSNSGAVRVTQALLAEMPAQGATHCQTKDQGSLPVEVFVLPLSDKRGRVVNTLFLVSRLRFDLVEDFFLSLQPTQGNALMPPHVAGFWAIDKAGLICKLSGLVAAHLDAENQQRIQGKRLDNAGVFDAALTDWGAFYRSIAEHNLPDEVECCVTHNGHSQWYSMSGFKHCDAQGLTVGYYGSFCSISQRKLKENALRDATQRQSLVSKADSDGVWDWNLETDGCYLSPRVWRLVGRTSRRDVLMTELWRDLVHPDDRHVLQAEFKVAVTQGYERYQSEFRLQHQQGHYFAVQARGYILRNVQGKAIRISGALQDLSAQHQVQAQLRLLQNCVDSLHDTVLITRAGPARGLGSEIVYVNPAFERSTGYSSAEAVGRTPRILQGPQTCRRTLDKIAAALTAWQSIRCELLNYKKNGDLFWVELDIFPVKSDGGDWFTHWIGVQRDISLRKHAEQALQTTTDRLNMALDASQVGLWTIDLGRDEAFRDGYWSKMLGYPVQATTARVGEWRKLIHPDDLGRVLGNQNAALETHTGTFENEFRMRHADGRWVWIQSRGKVVERDTTGKPLVMAGTHLDVTARVQARLQLERSNTQLMHCLEHLTTGVIVQLDGIIKFANAAWLSMFGATHRDDAIGTRISSYVHPSELTTLVWRREQIMAGAVLAPHWFKFIHRSGRVFKAITNSTVIEWEGERHILATLAPLSDGALLIEETEKLRTHYESLLANQVEKDKVYAAHELHDSLGSQLAGISLKAASLKPLGGAGKLLEMAVDDLLENIKAASEMTRTLARGLAPVDDWPGAFGYAMKKLCHDFSLANTLQCELDINGDFDCVVGQQATHLYRITQEAIANALRHGAAQRINVSLTRSEDEMALTVFDDGKGFEVRSVLNEPRKGLGLSSMYARAHAIQAQISFEQMSPRGFCVSVNWTQRASISSWGALSHAQFKPA